MSSNRRGFHDSASAAISANRMCRVVHGKWILAGEHAVLRGSPALVFPVLNKCLEFSFVEGEGDLTADFAGVCGRELHLLFWGVIERALELAGQQRSSVAGKFHLYNTIPVGAGLGASAALCVGIGHWLVWKNWVDEEDLGEVSRQLENLFHGESSGVDIAVAIAGKGLHFERDKNIREVEVAWEPRWFLSYSGKRGVTSECVAKVKTLWREDRVLGEKIDRDMREAVEGAERALQEPCSEDSFDKLAGAINKARSCFEHWGLAGGETGEHMQHLLKLGAYAVKPTGSGDGGYVLSLWRKDPPPAVLSELIPLHLAPKGALKGALKG